MATQGQTTGTSKQSQQSGGGSSKDSETTHDKPQRGSQDFVRDTSGVDKEANRPEGADWQQGTRKAGGESDRDRSSDSGKNRSGDTQSR